MYAHFYQLSESPFNLTPDPKFHYVNESTRETLASMLHGIRSRKGFVTLIAEAGTGKTTMLKRVVEEIECDTRVVFVFNPGVSFDELLEFICMELEIRTDSTKRLHLLERLNQYLLEQLTEGRNVVVMIDEAQTLDSSVLEELRLLTNLETSKEKILQIVLSGQPELEDKLRHPKLRQLRQRIGVRCTLRPMQADEIGAYVETRLRGAGAERGDFFMPVALRRVWNASNGIPRVINAICDNAMMIAFAEGKRRIDSGVIREAVRDLQGDDSTAGWGSGLREWLSHPYARYAAAAVVALAFIVPTAINVWRGWNTTSAQQRLASVASDSGARAAAESSALSVAAPSPVRPGPQPLASREPAAAVAPASAVTIDAGEIPSAATGESQAAQPDSISRAGRPANRQGAFEHDSAVLETIRRAKLMARSTAARIYEGRRGSLEESASGRATKVASKDPRDARRGAAASEGYADESIVEVVGRDGFVGDDESAATEAQREAAAKEAAARELAAEQAAAKEAAARELAAEQAAAKKAAARKLAAERAAAEKAAAEKAAQEAAAAKQLAAAQAAAQEESLRTAAAESAARLASVNATGPAAGDVFVGRHIRVRPGETIWDIAVGSYGSAGPTTLTRLLNNNPGVRDPRRLAEGAHVFVPFQEAGQMVRQDSDQTYRVLLTVTPLRSAIDDVRFWMEREGFDVTLGMATLEGTEATYQLYALGIGTRVEATNLAQRVLEQRAVAGARSQPA